MLHALRRPAVEKRQGTKSRQEVVRERCRGLYGDLATERRLARGIRLGQETNLNVSARILLMVKFTFCPTRDFNELRVPKMNTYNFCVITFTTALGNSIERRDSRRLRKSRL
jgi:hypothetical protein